MRPRWIVTLALVVIAACSAPIGLTPAPSTPKASSTPTASPSSAASLASSAPPSAQPAIGATELAGTILFGRMGGGFGDATIFTANADGSDDARVGGFLADKTTCCPRWSPDGSRMAIPVINDDELFTTGLIDPDGANLRAFDLPRGWEGGCSLWTPDGERMVCEGGYRDDPASGGIYTVRADDGSDPQPVIVDVGMTILRDISPDGSQVVFIGDPVGPPTGIDAGAPYGSLYVVRVDGTGLRKITPDGVYALFSSRWSPDGDWILFAGIGRTAEPIYAVRPDGSDLRTVFADSRRGAVHPAWSPDGTFIVFALDPPGTMATLSQSPPNELCVIRADGGDLTCLIATPDHKIWMDWVDPER